jgi:para-nitrobenzyl esterase
MTRHRILPVTILLLSATAFAGVAFAAPGGVPGPNPNAPGQQNKANGPTVSTTDGPVQGFVENGVNKFLGIPYAAPPVGDLRWKAPQPPAHHGKLDATEFGNTCPQTTTLGAFAGPATTTEDCLYLNVYTSSTSGSKPVLVWIHGGGNFDGASDGYDGSKLATGGPNGVPTVVVVMNYRLGLFGFISHPALNTGSAWGNYGILDQQAVLRWVKANIANFGGDPNNVTMGGQSAGAQDTSANMISPLADGLFHRAIPQSGPTSGFTDTATALSRGQAFATAAGCSTAACLRGLSAARILQLQGTANANGPYVTGPFVDGTVIPLNAQDAWTSGQYTHMPILEGNVKDEGLFGLSINEYFTGVPQKALTPTDYAANNPPAVLAQYPLGNYFDGVAPGNPTWAQDRINTDPGKCRSLRIIKQQAPTNGGYPIYAYDFQYQNSPYYFPQMPNPYNATNGFHFQARAYHTADIQFQFVNWHGGNLGVNLDQYSGSPRELQGSEIGLSDQLVAAWTNFAANGDPNGTGAPTWAAFVSGTGPFLAQDIVSSNESEAQYRANYKCDFWD